MNEWIIMCYKRQKDFCLFFFFQKGFWPLGVNLVMRTTQHIAHQRLLLWQRPFTFRLSLDLFLSKTNDTSHTFTLIHKGHTLHLFYFANISCCLDPGFVWSFGDTRDWQRATHWLWQMGFCMKVTAEHRHDLRRHSWGRGAVSAGARWELSALLWTHCCWGMSLCYCCCYWLQLGDG